MLFWTKLLTIAHSVTTSIYPFMPLYYTHMLKLDVLTISILTACVFILRIPASAFWIDLVDHRSLLHGVFTGLLTAMGTAGILLILSVSPTSTALILPAAIISAILDGLFYQPILVLIDSAIIKILGDYKILYANERQYGKFVTAIMSLIIGWFLNDDHDFDTLMVTTLLGSVGLFLLSLSTNVQAADPSLLGISETSQYDIIDETSSLTKYGAFCPSRDEINIIVPERDEIGSNTCYKPYSLFGEELSHISEEDASMLQRMATNNDNCSISIKPTAPTSLPRPASSIKGSISHLSLSNNITTEEDSFILLTYQQRRSPFNSKSRIYNSTNNIPLLNEYLPPSFELARLPYPPPEAPIVVLITLFPGYYKNSNNLYRNPSQLPPPLLPIPPQQQEEEHFYLQCSLAKHYQQQSKWIMKSFLSSTFCLGVVYGMTQSLVYLYLHDTLMLPMHMVGVIGFMMVSADLLANQFVIWIIQKFHLSMIIASAHIVLIACALIYTCILPAAEPLFFTSFLVITLQLLHGLSLCSIWLLGAHQVDAVVLTGHKRMMLKGGMAALYSGLGPAIGVSLMGYLVNQYGQEAGYTLVYQYAAGFATLGAILSWEWSTTN